MNNYMQFKINKALMAGDLRIIYIITMYLCCWWIQIEVHYYLVTTLVVFTLTDHAASKVCI